MRDICGTYAGHTILFYFKDPAVRFTGNSFGGTGEHRGTWFKDKRNENYFNW